MIKDLALLLLGISLVVMLGFSLWKLAYIHDWEDYKRRHACQIIDDADAKTILICGDGREYDGKN